MSKNKIITILTVCAVIFSALACWLIYTYVSPQRATIYTFNADYKTGQQVTTDMLIPIQVDATIVSAGDSTSVSTEFVTSETISSVLKSGDSLRIDVSEGMPLTSAMLSVSGGSTIEMNMKGSSIAVSIPVTQFSGITNDLKDGARVNVYQTADGKTTLLQQNVRVLEVFKDADEGTITGVALEEDVYGSMEIVNAASSDGTVYLGLIDGSGYQAVEGGNLSYPESVVSSGDDLSAEEEYQQFLEEAAQEQKESESETDSYAMESETTDVKESESEAVGGVYTPE